MAQTLTIDYRKPFALFPLEQVVLLPHAAAPLHIFEPRYRAMTSDALDSTGLIAMAMFEGSDWKEQYHDSPPLRPQVCVGYIVKHDRLSDGRYNIILQGVARATLIEELEPDHEGYRRGRLEPLPDDDSFEMDFEDAREQLDDLLCSDALLQLASVRAMQDWLKAELPTPALVDLVTCVVCRDNEQRYTMLAEPDASARARWLVGFLQRTRRTLQLADSQGPAQDDEGLPLN